jgi:hypothetical protein
VVNTMGEIRDWSRNRRMWIRVLEKQTGQSLTPGIERM